MQGHDRDAMKDHNSGTTALSVLKLVGCAFFFSIEVVAAGVT